MKPNIPFKPFSLAGSLLCVALMGCSSHHDGPEPCADMAVNFRVQTHASTRATGEGYEDATDWENYIDIAHGDYRIGFFDKNNRCITTFIPTKIEAKENTHYVDYTLTGKVPPVLTMYSDFKIVMLANWGSYPDMVDGITTIDDICCPPADDSRLGQFRHFDGSGFSIADGARYVPMYGVKEYTGVKFGLDNENNPTVVYGDTYSPVNMLRAIAKVEVMFDTEDPYQLDDAKDFVVTNYNDYGYCAPEGAYSEDDYYHSTWAANYRKGFLHLVGGQNDTGADKPLAMTKTVTADNKTVWVTYLPEYRNLVATSADSDCKNSTGAAAAEVSKARIAIPLIKGGEAYTSYIEFATHTDGEPDQYMNIERNNLYRFTITHIDPGVKWIVEALPWNGLEHEEIVM